MKYHAIVTPDGIIVHLAGPVEGRRHDRFIFNQSGIVELLEKYANREDGTPFVIYGDPAYGINRHLISPFRGPRNLLTENERRFNSLMSRVRIVVEWVFKEVTQQFSFLDRKRSQKLLLSPVGTQYIVAVLLHNAHVCLHEPQIPKYFQTSESLSLDLNRHEQLLSKDINNGSNSGFSKEVSEIQLIKPPTLEEYFHR